MTQTLDATPSGEEYGIKLSFGGPETICNADKKGITALTWVEPKKNTVSDLALGAYYVLTKVRQRFLVHGKPGMISLWSDISSGLDWHGTRVLLLQTQKNSIGASSLHPVSGICYATRQDCIVVSLFDGSFHVIHAVSTNPSLEPTEPGAPTTSTLSTAARNVFSHVEQEEVRFSDANRTSGMVSFGDSTTFLWLHECVVFSRRRTSLIERQTGAVVLRTLATNTMPNTTACW